MEAHYHKPNNNNHRYLQDALVNITSAGGNAVRLWLHIDGSLTPTFSTGTPAVVEGMSRAAINDLKWFLEQSHKTHIKVLLCLWSHDLLAVRRSAFSRFSSSQEVLTGGMHAPASSIHALGPRPCLVVVK